MSGTTSDLFVKTYSDLKYRFPVMVRHNGVVLAFAMDDARRIHYTVLDFGPGGSMSVQDADHWSPNPQPLRFATEIASVGIGAADQYAVAAVRQGSTVAVPPGQPVLAPDETDPFLSSTAKRSRRRHRSRSCPTTATCTCSGRRSRIRLRPLSTRHS